MFVGFLERKIPGKNGEVPPREVYAFGGWPFGCGSKPMGSHFGVGEFTTHFRTYLSGDWDLHWGCDLDFDPWLFVLVVWIGGLGIAHGSCRG